MRTGIWYDEKPRVKLLVFVHSVWMIALIAVLAAFCWAPILPMSEVIAVRGAEEEGADYGRMRLWGSLAFIVASLGGGLALDIIGQLPIQIQIVVE